MIPEETDSKSNSGKGFESKSSKRRVKSFSDGKKKKFEGFESERSELDPRSKSEVVEDLIKKLEEVGSWDEVLGESGQGKSISTSDEFEENCLEISFKDFERILNKY